MPAITPTTKTYHGQRNGPDAWDVYVDGPDGTRRLVHQVNHSVTGMSWGYEGSGPADLARSILTEHLGRIPHPAIYQRFKRDFVARWPQDGCWAITQQLVGEWLDTNAAASVDWKRHLQLCPTCGFDIAELKDGADLVPGLDCDNPLHYRPRGRD